MLVGSVGSVGSLGDVEAEELGVVELGEPGMDVDDPGGGVLPGSSGRAGGFGCTGMVTTRVPPVGSMIVVVVLDGGADDGAVLGWLDPVPDVGAGGAPPPAAAGATGPGTVAPCGGLPAVDPWPVNIVASTPNSVAISTPKTVSNA
ncbi:hypothetical protein [Labedaea rhizosphaerae]|uniref:Uncharacterized protein n=1 Tax=Labedaea rhizosphaerae TaxID=598644 RepID=A0A4R6SE74_LABRH|nr:hypothetical protein [Labedaea rhizosphaerae]TDP97425.1 hypothetical protein EV186_103389 [Labedaea rhizosphaerae]